MLLNKGFTDKNAIMPFVLILLLGSLLRFYGLEDQSFWNDELASWQISSYDSLSAVINEGVLYEINPPGYYILLYYVQNHIGSSEWILRFPSAVAGVLAIPAIFLVGRCFYSYKEGLIASALMAVLYGPIYYSQEARVYSMLLLFTLLSMYFWSSIVKDLSENVRLSYVIVFSYIITAIISSYLHYFALYFVMLQGFWTMLVSARRRESLVYVLLIYSPILIAYLPWLPAMFYQLNYNVYTIVWIKPPRITDFFHYLEFSFNGSTQLQLVVIVLYSFHLLRSLYIDLRIRRCQNIKITLLAPDLLLVLWLIVPFTTVYLKSTLSTPILVFRYLIISLPAAYLLLSRAITQLPVRSRNQVILALLIIGLFLSHFVFSTNYYSQPHKEQFREAVDFIVQHDPLYEDSLIVGYVWHGDYLNYYFEKKGSARRVNIIGGAKEDIPIIAGMIGTENPQYVWYIRAHREPDVEFIDFLNKNLAMIDHKEFIGADVWLFENEKIPEDG